MQRLNELQFDSTLLATAMRPINKKFSERDYWFYGLVVVLLVLVLGIFLGPAYLRW